MVISSKGNPLNLLNKFPPAAGQFYGYMYDSGQAVAKMCHLSSRKSVTKAAQADQKSGLQWGMIMRVCYYNYNYIITFLYYIFRKHVV